MKNLKKFATSLLTEIYLADQAESLLKTITAIL